MEEEGKAAATRIEVGRIEEEIEVVKLAVAGAVELVRGLAWEENEAKERARLRLRLRISELAFALGGGGS